MSKTVFVVVSHLEVESGNYSTEVVKAFNEFVNATKFAKVLKKQAKADNSPEIIEIEELTVE